MCNYNGGLQVQCYYCRRGVMEHAALEINPLFLLSTLILKIMPFLHAVYLCLSHLLFKFLSLFWIVMVTFAIKLAHKILVWGKWALGLHMFPHFFHLSAHKTCLHVLKNYNYWVVSYPSWNICTSHFHHLALHSNFCYLLTEALDFVDLW